MSPNEQEFRDKARELAAKNPRFPGLHKLALGFIRERCLKILESDDELELVRFFVASMLGMTEGYLQEGACHADAPSVSQ